MPVIVSRIPGSLYLVHGPDALMVLTTAAPAMTEVRPPSGEQSRLWHSL